MSPNLLERVSESDVIAEPFPHIIIRRPIADAIADRLIADWPDEHVIRRGRMRRSNRRLDYDAREIFADTRIAESWRGFIAEQSSPAFLRHVARIFSSWLPKEHPELVRRFGADLDGIRAGVRYVDDYSQRDLLIDARLSINTPVRMWPTSVRPAHLDLPTKLFVGLYYLRPDDDRDSRGGDLTVCRLRPGERPRFSRFEVDDRCVENVTVIPYEKNVLMLFLNTPRSIHAVTPRFPTPHTRRFVNIIGEVAQPLFNVDAHQEPRLKYLAHYYRRQLLAWRA
jgi:hypothetical protein